MLTIVAYYLCIVNQCYRSTHVQIFRTTAKFAHNSDCFKAKSPNSRTIFTMIFRLMYLSCFKKSKKKSRDSLKMLSYLKISWNIIVALRGNDHIFSLSNEFLSDHNRHAMVLLTSALLTSHLMQVNRPSVLLLGFHYNYLFLTTPDCICWFS